MPVLTEDNGTDRVLFEVQRHAERVTGELEHLAIASVGQAVNTNDTVGHGHDRADIARFGFCLEILDAFFNQLTDFRSFECHHLFLFS